MFEPYNEGGANIPANCQLPDGAGPCPAYRNISVKATAFEKAHGRLRALRNHHARLCNDPEAMSMLSRESLVMQLSEVIDGVFARDVVSMGEEIDKLKRSRKLCHEYAGCTLGNCELDGDECPAQESSGV